MNVVEYCIFFRKCCDIISSVSKCLIEAIVLQFNQTQTETILLHSASLIKSSALHTLLCDTEGGVQGVPALFERGLFSWPCVCRNIVFVFGIW